MVLMRAETPSSLDCFQPIGNVIGRAEERIEVESIARVLAEIAHVHQNPSAQALLNAGVILIAAAERDGLLFAPFP